MVPSARAEHSGGGSNLTTGPSSGGDWLSNRARQGVGHPQHKTRLSQYFIETFQTLKRLIDKTVWCSLGVV
jgi:hypothetical protein